MELVDWRTWNDSVPYDVEQKYLKLIRESESLDEVQSQLAALQAEVDALTTDVEGKADAPVTWASVTSKPSTFPPSTHSHAASAVTATAISPGTATNVQGILAELAARITTLENEVPA